MTVIKFQPLKNSIANRISIGDKHDNSLEFRMKHSNHEVFLIERRGSKMLLSEGRIIIPEKVEAPEPPDPRPVPKAETAKPKSKPKSKSRRGR